MVRISLKMCLVIAALFCSSGVNSSPEYLAQQRSEYTATTGMTIDNVVQKFGPPLEIQKRGKKQALKYFKVGFLTDVITIFWIDKTQVIGVQKLSIKGQLTRVSRATPINWAMGPFKNTAFSPAKKKLSILENYFRKLSLSERKLVQTSLKKQNYYKFSIDGLYGKGTAAALNEYNKKHLSASNLKVAANVKNLMDKVLAFATAGKPITLSEAVSFKQIKEEFGLSYYGGFIHSDRVPNALFFTTDIQKNDSFEFRKALRNHDIDLIVLSSPGGSVFEGLQTAGIIHDNNLKTYIPKKSFNGPGNCASACSFMFFAGDSRRAEGSLGVHQFYSGKASAEEKIGTTQKQAQFTVSEIIGFLNEFETPAWVYERMFQQSEMYYFGQSELLQLETEISEETINQHVKAERFISDFRSAFAKITN